MNTDVRVREAPPMRWWQYSWGYRVLLQIIVWLLLVIGLTFFIQFFTELHHELNIEAWSHLAGGIVCVLFGLAYSRYQLLAVSYNQEGLLIRRIFPGWVEHIPWARIRRGWLIHDFFSHHLFFFLPRALPMQINSSQWMPRVPDWEGLLTGLRSHLAEKNKWRE